MTRASLRKQDGVVLIIALIVLVAMTLASVAMVRSVDTSTLIAGNLAFKQSGIASGDAGVNAGIAWINENMGVLEYDLAASGYYATSQDCLDLTGNGKVGKKCLPPFSKFDWSNPAGVHTLDKDDAGNQVSFVIHRLCNAEGALSADKCSVEEGKLEGDSKGGVVQQARYGAASWSTAAIRGFYRITVRIAGNRNNVSYVQAVISR